MRSISKQTSYSCCSWACCLGCLYSGLRSRGRYSFGRLSSVNRLKHSVNTIVSPFHELWRQAIETMLVCRPHFPRIRIAGRRPITACCGFASAYPGPCAHPGRWFLPLPESRLSLSSCLRGPAARSPHALSPSSLTASVCSSLTQSLVTVHLRRPEGHQSRLSLRLQARRPQYLLEPFIILAPIPRPPVYAVTDGLVKLHVCFLPAVLSSARPQSRPQTTTQLASTDLHLRRRHHRQYGPLRLRLHALLRRSTGARLPTTHENPPAPKA
jgi:hypothetical protein